MQRSAAAGIAALFLACAGSTPDGDAPPVRTGDFETLRAREVELPKPGVLAPPDGSFRAEAPARLDAALEKAEGAWYGTFDIGSDESVECFFFEEEKDVAASLDALTTAYIEEVAKNRDLGQRRVLAIDAGAVGSTPYLGVDWLVVLDSLAYQLKFKFASKGDRGIYCSHGETGYEKSFDDFFRGLVGSYVGGSRETAQYRDVILVSIGELTVGFQTLAVSRNANGEFHSITRGSTLIPSAADAVIPNDDFIMERSHSNGALIRQFSISSDGNSLTHLELEPTSEGWDVGGQMQGKDIAASFEAAAPLLSTRGEYRLMRRVARGEFAGDVSYGRWMGPVNPVAVTPCVARSLGGSRVQVEAGPITMDFEMDERGIVGGVIHMGRLEMLVKRVYVEGGF